MCSNEIQLRGKHLTYSANTSFFGGRREKHTAAAQGNLSSWKPVCELRNLERAVQNIFITKYKLALSFVYG